MALIMAPAANRTAIQGLPDLPSARGPDRALSVMKIKAAPLPVKTKKTDQSAAFTFEVPDQVLILNFQDAVWKHLAPMRNQTFNLADAKGDIAQVTRPRKRLAELCEVAR